MTLPGPLKRAFGSDRGAGSRRRRASLAKVPLLRMEIVKRSDDMKGFVILPHRWVVERTFSWFRTQPESRKGF